jgi:hypothetical protein
MRSAVEQAMKWEEVLVLGLRYEDDPRSRGFCRRCPSLQEDGSLTVYNGGHIESWCGMSNAVFLYDVIEPIARYRVWVSSRHDVQSRENRVKGAGNVGEKMQPIITLDNRSVN